jgi:hypothetical protein
MMFGVGTATRVYLALGATDMRKGFEGLHGLVRQRLELDPLSGHLFLFCNRSRTRLKVLFWDGSGLWVCAKTHATHCLHRDFSAGSLPVSPLLRTRSRSVWRCERRPRHHLRSTAE